MTINSESRIQNSELKQRVNEFVGMFFYGTMLKQARNTRLTDTDVGYGGRGEEVFAAQLDQMLAERMGRRDDNNLTEAIYTQIRPRR